MGCLRLNLLEQDCKSCEQKIFAVKNTLTLNKTEKKAHSAYLYGFNGQEKDNEVAGSGTSYTAQFWQYDSRLGRRWNRDPVVKPWRSPYDAFYDNPINRVDPNGDDDYFDKKGTFLGSDGSETNNIRVITDDGLAQELLMNAGNQMINPNFALPNSKLIGDFDYSDCDETRVNRSMLTTIAKYYAPEAGVDPDKLRVENNPSSNSEAAAYYDFVGDIYGISVDPASGSVSGTLNNKYVLVNVLVHEKAHEDNIDTRVPLGHPLANIAMSEHSSWDNVPQSHKSAALNYSLNLLNQALSEGANLDQVKGVIDRVNNSRLQEGGFIFYDETSKRVEGVLLLQGTDITPESPSED
jgi:hypothetical protein